jgi:hypothetical protein
MIPDRACVLPSSGSRRDLLNPDPRGWTSHDLSVPLLCAIASAWDLPLSLAQCSFTLLTLRQTLTDAAVTPPSCARESWRHAQAVRGPFSARARTHLRMGTTLDQTAADLSSTRVSNLQTAFSQRRTAKRCGNVPLG